MIKENKLSNKLINILDYDKSYSQEKKELIGYGLELILDSAIKFFVYLMIGIVIDKFYEVLFAVFVFGFVRKYVGGIHAKTGTGCFILTGIAIAMSISAPHIMGDNMKIRILLFLIINTLYLVFAPYDEYFDQLDQKKYYIVKCKIMILINILLLFLFSISWYWGAIGIGAILAEGITLIRRRNLK